MIIKKIISLKSLILFFAYFSAFIFFFISLIKLDLSITFLNVLFIFLSLFFLKMILKFLSSSYVAIFFSIYFVVGFYLKTSLIIWDPSPDIWFFMRTLGEFDLSFESFFHLYSIIITSTLGILCAFYLSKCNQDINIEDILYDYFKLSGSKKFPFLTVLIWALFCILLLWFTTKYGIGRHGLKNQNELPNFIAGFLNYSKVFMIIGLGLILYDLKVKNCKKNLQIFYFIIFLILLFFQSYLSLSRSFFIIGASPIILLFIFYNQSKVHSNGKVNPKIFLIIFIILLIFGVYAEFSNLNRRQLYLSSEQLNDADVIIDLFSSFSNFLNLIINRIEGSRELMVLLDYPSKNFSNYFLSISGYGGGYDVNGELYSISKMADDKVAFGITLGFFAQSFLSGSYIICFLHSLIYFFIIIKIEIFFKKRGLYLFSTWLSFYLFILIWGNLTFFHGIRILFMIVLMYIFTLILKSKVRFENI